MNKYLFLLSSSVALAQPAWAGEDTGADLDAVSGEGRNITVTATGLPQPVDRTGQAVSVIDREEIEAIQGTDVTRILRRLPGTTFTRNGGLGGLTLLGVRGASAGQTLVLIDGVRVNDPANANGEFDLAQLAAGTIERIELLRGPNSVVWGSQAIGGVMNIVTRQQNGVSASIEYGGDDQVTATAAAGHVGERLEAGISGSFVDAEGFSSASAGTEKDGFRHYNLAGRGRYRLTDSLALTANARYSEGKTDLDGFPAPDFTYNDTEATEELTAWSGRTGLFYSAGGLTLDAGFAIADTKRVGNDPSFPYRLDGRSERLEVFGRVELPGNFALNFGGDHEWSRFSNAPDAGDAETTSGHALLGYYGERLVVTAGLRYDDHSDYGNAWTVGASGSYEFAPDWRFRASYGEGFKAPTLYQLLSQYGNPGLDPERTKTYEVGVSYGSGGDPVYLAVSAYRRDATNLIDFFSCFSGSDPLCSSRPFGFYYNADRARAQGIEFEARLEFAPGLDAGFVYSYTDTEYRTPGGIREGNAFGRRPDHMVTGSLDWRSPIGLALGIDIRVVSDSWDNPANSAKLDGYALGDIRASYPVSDKVEIFGRIENVWNTDYETALGYNTQGRAAYLGARLRM